MQWDCPDTIQAAFRYPGFDVVYEGMMNSSIDDGGLEFRGTEATLKIDRSGFAVYREHVEEGTESRAHCAQRPRRHHHAHGEFLRMHQDPQGAQRARRNWSRRRSRRTHRQPRLSPRPPSLAGEVVKTVLLGSCLDPRNQNREGHDLQRLRKNSQTRAVLWKSGASAPRKAYRISSGFSPGGRLLAGETEFSATSYSRAAGTRKDIATSAAEVQGAPLLAPFARSGDFDSLTAPRTAGNPHSDASSQTPHSDSPSTPTRAACRTTAVRSGWELSNRWNSCPINCGGAEFVAFQRIGEIRKSAPISFSLPLGVGS